MPPTPSAQRNADDIVSLREYVEAMLVQSDLRYQQRFDAQTIAVNAAMSAAEKAINTALLASEKAVLKAETASERRFESVNEFRGSLNDMVSTLIPRKEADERFKALAEKLDALQGRIDKNEGSGAGMRQGWGLLIGAIGMLAALGSIVVMVSQRGS